MLKKLAVAALAASAVVAVRKRSAGKGEADLWAEATRGPDPLRGRRRAARRLVEVHGPVAQAVRAHP